MIEKEAEATEGLLRSVFRLNKQQLSYKNKEICSVLAVISRRKVGVTYQVFVSTSSPLYSYQPRGSQALEAHISQRKPPVKVSKTDLFPRIDLVSAYQRY